MDEQNNNSGEEEDTSLVVAVPPIEPIDKSEELQQHPGDGLSVSTKLTHGPMPKLELSWGVDIWKRGSRLLAFHSTSGFCAHDDPDDLHHHGDLIIETQQNNSKSLFLEEGKHFFTFVLRRKWLFKRWFELRSQPLRVLVEVPSAKIAVSRINDHIEIREQQHQIQLRPIEQKAERNEAEVRLHQSAAKLKAIQNPQSKEKRNGNPIIAAQSKWIDNLIESMYAKRTKITDLDHDERFQKLSDDEKQFILKEIEKRFHPGEISAQTEMRGH
jgi:hypothetical protein